MPMPFNVGLDRIVCGRVRVYRVSSVVVVLQYLGARFSPVNTRDGAFTKSWVWIEQRICAYSVIFNNSRAQVNVGSGA